MCCIAINKYETLYNSNLDAKTEALGGLLAMDAPVRYDGIRCSISFFGQIKSVDVELESCCYGVYEQGTRTAEMLISMAILGASED